MVYVGIPSTSEYVHKKYEYDMGTRDFWKPHSRFGDNLVRL